MLGVAAASPVCLFRRLKLALHMYRVDQREGRWDSGAFRPYAVNNSEDSPEIWRTLANKKSGV